MLEYETPTVTVIVFTVDPIATSADPWEGEIDPAGGPISDEISSV